MRFGLLTLLGIIFAVGILTGCNSKDLLVTQAQKAAQPPQAGQTPQTAPTPPADNARRITADELHKLWEKNEVLIIDTRAEPAYREEHIKGAISVPSNEVEARIEELPRTRMIVAYCT
jgi:3-mercaptopyruvate sulfurtransferase SseA